MANYAGYEPYRTELRIVWGKDREWFLIGKTRKLLVISHRGMMYIGKYLNELLVYTFVA